MTGKYLDKYVTHMKLVYSEWELKNAGWLDKTEKVIEKVVCEMEDEDILQLFQEVA